MQRELFSLRHTRGSPIVRADEYLTVEVAQNDENPEYTDVRVYKYDSIKRDRVLLREETVE